jgi:hypothetical protein
MADDQRLAESANRADTERRAAQAIAEMTAARSPHDAAMDAQSAAAAGGYAKEAS